MITTATYADCLHVARRLRRLDVDEIFPMLHHKTPEALAAQSVAATAVWVAVATNGEPVAVFGWSPTFPCVAQVFMYATDRWAEVAKPVSKFCATRMKLMMAARAGSINRAECWCLDRHTVARRWLEWLGFQTFGIAHDMGPNRETYVGYCFTRSMIETENLARAQKRKGVFHAGSRIRQPRNSRRAKGGRKLPPEQTAEGLSV